MADGATSLPMGVKRATLALSTSNNSGLRSGPDPGVAPSLDQNMQQTAEQGVGAPLVASAS